MFSKSIQRYVERRLPMMQRYCISWQVALTVSRLSVQTRAMREASVRPKGRPSLDLKARILGDEEAYCQILMRNSAGREENWGHV